ncbi:MAG TPA: hypothetical protein VKB50_17240 [Vicinamibacterales bacterium]|nr:hypothetical protein [Vicinamibacterales bacterium]
MRTRVSAVAIALVVALVSIGLAQSSKPRPSASASGARGYTPARTPWGDPDLQGTFTNSNEYATPLERPARFAGRTLNDITDKELASIRESAEQEAIAGLAPGPRGPDYWWLENLNLSKRAQAWSVVDPPDGRIPALTPQARARGAGPPRTSFMGGPFNAPSDFGMLERCISRGVPGSMIPVMYGNNYEIVQTPGVVVITYEIIHEVRIIPLDGRPHVGAGVRSHMGDARGHWEGNTLVVETTNFTAASAYRGANPDTLRVIERFARVAPDTIAWSATLDDPDTWTRPWTIAMPLTLDTLPLLPFECHEHNYGLANILRAARAAEKGAQ